MGAVIVFLGIGFFFYMLIGWIVTLCDFDLDEDDFTYDLAVLFWPIYLIIRIIRWIISWFDKDGGYIDPHQGWF